MVAEQCHAEGLAAADLNHTQAVPPAGVWHGNACGPPAVLLVAGAQLAIRVGAKAQDAATHTEGKAVVPACGNGCDPAGVAATWIAGIIFVKVVPASHPPSSLNKIF